MTYSTDRREFLKAALAAGTALPAALSLFSNPLLAADAANSSRSPNEKLKLGIIGVANRGGNNLAAVSGEEITVLCDIDDNHLESVKKRFPHADVTHDFRDVFDRDDLDGVVVSTPDHMHAIPVVRALKKGWAVYCEKPLTHSLHEARVIRQLAAKTPVATQMGNQIHSLDNYRRVVEIVQAGVIGTVRRVHVWQGGGIDWRNGVKRGEYALKTDPPKHVDYDLWIGPAPYRPYHVSHFHFNWRYWWDFGGGQLADFGCHYMDLPFWALDLDAPTSVVVVGEKGHDGENNCPNFMKVDYEFPATSSRPAVHMTWYHGGWIPKGAEVYGKNSAVLFEGDDGRLIADYTTRKLYMEGGKTAEAVEPTIPSSLGQQLEWLAAIRGEGKTLCHFEYAGRLTETVHLGNVSYRLGQKKIAWDAESADCPGTPEAKQFLQREYRKGWSLETAS